MARRRRLRRWLLRGLAGLAALIALVLGGALATLETDWGRRLVARQVEHALNGLLRGHVVIGTLEGHLVAQVVALDVVVSDATGGEAVRIRRLEASYSLLALLGHTIRLHDVRVIDPTFTARRYPDGTLNLLAILPVETKEPGEPSPWRVVVTHATVTGGKLALDGLHLDGIELALAIDQGGTHLRVGLDRARARWVEKDLVLEARGQLDRNGDAVKLEGFEVRAAGSRVAIARATGRADGSQLQAEVAIEVQRADVLRFVPDLPLRADLVAAGTVSRAGPGDRFQAHLTGTLAGAAWALDAHVGADPPAASGSFHIDGVDPAAVWATAPAGLVRLALTADLAGTSVATLRGSARVEASGQIGGNPVDGVTAELSVAAGVVRARVQAQAPGARLDLDAAVDVAARPLVVRSARLQAKVPEIGRFAGDLPVRGDVVADLTGSGPLDDLKVAGTVRGTALRYRDVRAASLVVDGDVAGLPRDAVGHARVEASGVQRGTTTFGRVRAEGDFRDRGRTIELSLQAGAPGLAYGVRARAGIARTPGGPTVIQVRELTLRTRQLTWSGGAGSVTLEPDGGVVVKDLSLASTAGRIRASGQLRAAGDRLDVDVKELHLEELRRAVLPDLPGLPDVRGTVEAHVTLLQRDHRLRRVQVKVSARALELRPTIDPISLDVEATLDGRDVQAKLSVDGGRTGTVDVDVDTRAPVDPLDLAAWRRLDERDLRKVHIALARVDVARVLALLDQEPGPVGLVDATIDAGPGLTTLAARVATVGLVTPYLDRPLSAEVALELARRRLAIDAHARREGGGEVTLTARVAAPARLSSVEEWQRVDVDDVEALRLSFADVELAWLQPLRDRFPDIHGKVSGSVAARARGDDLITADLRLDGVRAAPLIVPLSARLRTSLYDRRVTVDLDSSLGDRRLAEVHGTIAAGLEAIRSGRTGDFLAAAASGKVRIDDLPIEVLGRALDLPVPASGVLKVAADVSGTVRHPVVDMTAALAGARVGKVAFVRIDARAHLDPRQLSASVVAAQEAGGSFHTDVQVNLGDVRDGKLTMTAKRFDLGFLALLARERGVTVTKGFLDADLAIDGTFAQNHPRGSLRISDGDLRLTEMMETFHEASLELTLGPGDAVAVQLDARVGNDGRLSLSGTANLVGLSLRDARGTFASHKLSVSAGKTAAEIDARGSFTGVRQADLYLLTTTLEEGAINLPKLSGGKVHPTGVPDDVVFIDARGRREPVQPRAAGAPFLRVRLRTDQPILVTSQELRAELDVMLNVTLAPRATTINGQIRIETGFAVLFGRRWSFQASTLFFGGESPPDPRLDIKLGYEFQATTVVIALAGTLAKPELALLAESGDYDQAQLLGFVLGGSPDDGGPASGGDVSQQALGAGVGLVLGQLQPLLKKVVPVDVVSLQTRTGAKEDTLFTVGKWFFSDLFVAYQQRFGSQADEQQNTYEGRLEWYFARGFRLDLIFGDRGEGSADVLSIHRW